MSSILLGFRQMMVDIFHVRVEPILPRNAVNKSQELWNCATQGITELTAANYSHELHTIIVGNAAANQIRWFLLYAYLPSGFLSSFLHSRLFCMTYQYICQRAEKTNRIFFLNALKLMNGTKNVEAAGFTVFIFAPNHIKSVEVVLSLYLCISRIYGFCDVRSSSGLSHHP